jgi:hypothetical protein
MMPGREIALTAFAIGLLAVPCLSAAQEQGDAATPPSKGPAAPDAGPAEPRSFFPLLADEALKRGYELPLPYGASLVVTGLANREIEVTDVRLDLDGAPVLPHADFVNLGSSSDVFNANLKFDIFVLPFLNVYALLGYVYNESETTANITLTTPGPGGGDVVFERTIPTKLDGFIGGLGFALAGGYGNFFLVADASYIRAISASTTISRRRSPPCAPVTAALSEPSPSRHGSASEAGTRPQRPSATPTCPAASGSRSKRTSARTPNGCTTSARTSNSRRGSSWSPTSDSTSRAATCWSWGLPGGSAADQSMASATYQA